MRVKYIFPFLGGVPSAGRGISLARFARLNSVGKSAGHQLVSPADLPIKVTPLTIGTYRLVISREILPIHRSTNITCFQPNPISCPIAPRVFELMLVSRVRCALLFLLFLIYIFVLSSSTRTGGFTLSGIPRQAAVRVSSSPPPPPAPVHALLLITQRILGMPTDVGLQTVFALCTMNFYCPHVCGPPHPVAPSTCRVGYMFAVVMNPFTVRPNCSRSWE